MPAAHAQPRPRASAAARPPVFPLRPDVRDKACGPFPRQLPGGGAPWRGPRRQLAPGSAEEIPCPSGHLLFLPARQPGLAAGNSYSHLPWGREGGCSSPRSGMGFRYTWAVPTGGLWPRPWRPRHRGRSEDGSHPLGAHRAPGPVWGRVSGGDRGRWPLSAGSAELTAILLPLESGCPRTKPSPGRWGEGDGGGSGAGVGRASQRDHPSSGGQLRREQLGPDVRAKTPLCASARWSWVPSFVTKRLFRNVCDKLGARDGPEGRIRGVRVTRELDVHPLGHGSRATGQRGRSWREAPSAVARGALGRGPQAGGRPSNVRHPCLPPSVSRVHTKPGDRRVSRPVQAVQITCDMQVMVM